MDKIEEVKKIINSYLGSSSYAGEIETVGMNDLGFVHLVPEEWQSLKKQEGIDES